MKNHYLSIANHFWTFEHNFEDQIKIRESYINNLPEGFTRSTVQSINEFPAWYNPAMSNKSGRKTHSQHSNWSVNYVVLNSDQRSFSFITIVFETSWLITLGQLITHSFLFWFKCRNLFHNSCRLLDYDRVLEPPRGDRSRSKSRVLYQRKKKPTT